MGVVVIGFLRDKESRLRKLHTYLAERENRYGVRKNKMKLAPFETWCRHFGHETTFAINFDMATIRRENLGVKSIKLGTKQLHELMQRTHRTLIGLSAGSAGKPLAVKVEFDGPTEPLKRAGVTNLKILDVQ